jgi:hypothetical protein
MEIRRRLNILMGSYGWMRVWLFVGNKELKGNEGMIGNNILAGGVFGKRGKFH